MIEINAALPQDIPEMVTLLGILFTQESDFEPAPELQERALRTILSHPDIGQLHVARVDGKTIAMVSLLFTVSTATGGRAAWLEDMVVHPAHRDQGIGGRLLQHAIVEAKRSGCTRITLLTDGTNRQAQEFYRRAGFTPSEMVPLRLPLK